jgi:hypothetical protein
VKSQILYWIVFGKYAMKMFSNISWSWRALGKVDVMEMVKGVSAE